MLKKVGTYLGGAVAILFCLGWMIEWAVVAIWFLPVALWFGYFFKFDPKWSRLKFSLTFGLASTSTGIWTLLVARVIGPAVSPLWQRMLHSPVRGHTEDIGADGMIFPDSVALLSAFGMVCLALSVAAILAAKSSEVEERRCFWRGTLGLVMVGGVAAALVQLGFPMTAMLFGIGGGLYSLAGFVEDPKRLFEAPQ
jgi:hypothetical protein